MRSSIGLAASLLLAAAVWSVLLLVSPRSAQAVNEIPKRLMSLNSLHLKGAIYAPDGSHPFELFVQRPDRCRIIGRVCSGPHGTTITDVLITAQHRITLDPSTRTATIEPQNAEDARAAVAEILQAQLQMIFGAAPHFTKVGTEAVAGTQSDVYEAPIDDRTHVKIWLNTKSELPIKATIYRSDAGKPRELIAQFDTIEPDPVIDAAVFDPKIPENYAVKRVNPGAAPNPPATYSGCSFGHLHLSLRYQIALEKGDVLSCWCFYDDRHPGEDLKLPDDRIKVTITSIAGVSYKEHLVHADTTPQDYHWRWSLLRPDKPGEKSLAPLTWLARDAEGNSGRCTVVPVTYSAQDLPARIESMQRQTLAPDQKPMTVEQIERSLGK